jgi:hypothetical protein
MKNLEGQALCVECGTASPCITAAFLHYMSEHWHLDKALDGHCILCMLKSTAPLELSLPVTTN